MDLKEAQKPDTPETEFPAKPDAEKRLKDQPEYRMGDASQLLKLVRATEKSDVRLHFLDVCAEVDDMYDRRPPDDPNALAMEGLGWTNNVDWGGMEFGIDSAIAPEFNLLHSPETYIRLETRYQGYDGARQKNIVEREDKRMLDEWESWIPELGEMLIQRKKYGMGVFYFRSPRSWQFQTLHPGNLLTNAPTMNPAKWPWCAIPTEFDITDLLLKKDDKGKVDDKGFSDDGWNRKAIERAVYYHTRESRYESVMSFSDPNWRNQYLAGDLYYSHQNSMSIPGYIVYVKEFDGSVTEYLLPKKEGVGFIYRSPKKQRLKQMSDAFFLFPENCSQTRFDQIRGYGIKNMAFFDAENQMVNRWLDSTWLSSSLFVEGGTADDLYAQQEMMVGAVTLLPSNLSIAASQMPNTGQAFVPIMQHLTQKKENASGATGGQGYGQGPDRETAKAATFRFQTGQQLKTYQVNFLYLLARGFHRGRFSRYMQDNMISSDPGYDQAKEAIEEMAKSGVTRDYIEQINYKSTQIATIFGDGDPARLFADLMDMMPFVGSMTQTGKQAFFRDLAHAKVGSERSKTYFGEGSEDPELVHNRAKAQLENGHLEKSDARLDAAGDDNHMVHSGEHVSFLEAKIAAMQDGAGTPEDIFATLSRGIAHIGFNEDGQPVGGHILPLMEQPEAQEFAQQIMQRMAEVVNLRRQIGQQLGAQQQAEQELQIQEMAMPLEEQAKAAKVEQEAQIEARKAELELAKMEQEAEFQRQKQELEIELLEAKVRSTLLTQTQTQQ